MKKPTVTELLDILNKPALMKWANKIGLQGVSLDEHRKQSRLRGTGYHKQVELCLKEGICFEEPHVQQAFDRFIIDKHVLDIEKTIEHEYFCGRCDIRLNVGGIEYLADFKSSANVYLETKLQLIAYGMVTRDDHFAIIHLPTFEFIPIKIPDTFPYEQIIKALVTIHQAKNAITTGIYKPRVAKDQLKLF